jgi:hypothetical protein
VTIIAIPVALLQELLEYVPKLYTSDIPRSCGACGTPNACCDMDCMEAAHMSHTIGLRRRLEKMLEGK